MRITWVTRTFLDYRIVVYKTLAEMPNVEFTLLTSQEHNSESLRTKIEKVLGKNVQFLTGERCFGTPYSPEQRGNSVRRVFWQPNLAKKIMETRPDVVITDAFNHWTLPVLNLRRSHHFKHIVCYERTAHTERNAPWLKRKFIQFVGRWIDAVHYNGILCHDFLRQLGYPEYKLKPGNMTVDVNQLSETCRHITQEENQDLRTSLNIGQEDVIFLFIGRLIPLKGLKEFLPGWQAWNMQHPNVHAQFLIVGDGPQKAELEAICHKCSLSNVIFAGACEYGNIPKYLSVSDIFVIPTLDDNWSLVVPEAMSCGKPILCSCYNGCWPELVHTEENGWVFDPLNVDDIQQTLAKAYARRDDWPMLGKFSQQLVERFSPKEIVSSIYRTCREPNKPVKPGFVATFVERLRMAFESFLKYKVHCGCVAHYRKMMKMNAVSNRFKEGEKVYLDKWRCLSPYVAKEDYRLFSTYIGPNADIVPEAISHNIVEAILTPGQYRPFYTDKNMFDLFMDNGMMPKTYLRHMQGTWRSVDYRVIPDTEISLNQLLPAEGYCVIKPTVDSSSGQRVTVFEHQKTGWCALNGDLKGELLTLTVLKRYFGSDFIIQEYLEQSEFMKHLCSTSVNTIRLSIYRSVKTEKVIVTAIVMRIGHTGSYIDNSHAGGVTIGIDVEGHLGKYAIDQWGVRYTRVNDIDFTTSDIQIPNFHRVLAFAQKVGEKLIHHRIANIDVMIDRNEQPRLIEYNLSSMSTWLYQFTSGPAYGKYSDEIIHYCIRNYQQAKHISIHY